MSQWIYRNSQNNGSRYVLGEKGSRPLVCIGVNPSTASPESLDNTVRQMKSRALALGYDSWMALNLYPQRATDPDTMHKRLHRDIHEANLQALKEVVPPDCHIWAAWGALIEKRPYLKKCLVDMRKVLGSDCSWFTIGQRSKAGHPHHPLYLKKDLPLAPFDIDRYISGLS
jgi:hypothetical protein